MKISKISKKHINKGRYICKECISSDAMDLIEYYCRKTHKSNPMEMAIELMENPKIAMHGPEHHYLVPAVLISSYYNITGETDLIRNKLKIARSRAKTVFPGICGSHGNCGAAVGAGIFISIIMNTTPLSRENWGLANQMTGMALIKMAKIGGPRCCKRNSFTAILEAVAFIDKSVGVKLFDYEDYNSICNFTEYNEVCLEKACPYYKKG